MHSLLGDGYSKSKVQDANGKRACGEATSGLQSHRCELGCGEAGHFSTSLRLNTVGFSMVLGIGLQSRSALSPPRCILEGKYQRARFFRIRATRQAFRIDQKAGFRFTRVKPYEHSCLSAPA